MTDFGKVTFNGKEYTLTTQADFTNRVLPTNNFNEASEGETYTAEFSAQTTNGVTVYWMFDFVKGEEQELDSLDWDNVDRVVEQ